jgi:inhibitor of cysteine peptidase
MRYSVLFLVFLLTLFLFSGCAGATGVIQLAEEDNDRTITMHVGDSLEVVLQGNPTTGYLWEMAPLEGKVLEQVGEGGYEAATDAIGSGGRFTFCFRAVKEGKVDLMWVYRRPFEKKAAPLKSFRVHVVVSE